VPGGAVRGLVVPGGAVRGLVVPGGAVRRVAVRGGGPCVGWLVRAGGEGLWALACAGRL
jgi:hypothetical protein